MWPEIRLADGAEAIQYGYTASASDDPDHIRFVRITDITGGRIDWSSVPGCEIDSQNEEKYRLREGDLLIARTGASAGSVARYSGSVDAVFASFLIRVRADKKRVNDRFLNAVLHSSRWWGYVEQNSGGSAQPQFNGPVLREFTFALPPLDEQQRVARLLGALDDKIDSNRRLAKLLEETAGTLFRARFVDFAGVEEMEDSEAGPIPPGWSLSSLSNIASFVNGKAFTKRATGLGRPILRIRELNNGVDASTLLNDVEAPDDAIARAGDILFAWSGSLDVYRWGGDEALINQHIFKVIPAGVPAWFVYGWIRQHMPAFQGFARDRAVTMGHIRRHHLDDAIVVKPSFEAIGAAKSLLDPVDDQIRALVAETRTLIAIRDALLPKLVSGEIRVPDTADPIETIEPLIAVGVEVADAATSEAA
jgi:type I restriction enzyme S subunit